MLAALVVLVAAAAGLAAWLGSESMLRSVVDRAARATDGRLEIESPTGSLLGTVRAARIVWSDAGTVVSADEVVIGLDPRALLAATLRVVELGAERVEVVSAPSDAPPAPPASLALPVRVELARARIGELLVRQAGSDSPLRLEAIDASGGYRRGRWTVDALSLRGAFGALRVGGSIADAPPFALQANALLETRALDAPIAVDATAIGDLSALELDARTVLHDASASARLSLAPYSPRPLAALDLVVTALDLSRFAPALPATRLEGRVRGRAPDPPRGAPTAGPAPALPPLAGTLSLHNAVRARRAAGRLPVGTLAAGFDFDGARLRLDALALDGPPGRLAGRASVGVPGRDGATPPFELHLETERLDLRRVHAALRETALRGAASLAPSGAGLGFDARLADGELSLEGRARLEGERLDVERARLQARDGVAELTGRIQVATPYRFDLSGTVARLDPSRFAALPPGLLNGRWRAGGVAAPAPEVGASVELADSRWRGLPLAGRSTVTWTSATRGRADRVSDVDVALTLGASSMRARGALGEPGDRLTLDVDAPRLRELDPGLSGRAALDVELRGALRAPGLSATGTAHELRVADRVAARTVKAGLDVDSPRALVDVLARLGLVAPAAVAEAPRSAARPASRGASRGGSRGPSAADAAAAAAAPATPLAAVLQADGLRVGDVAIDALRAQLAGDADAHVLSAGATAGAKGV
ncbi:MAG TPA: hypothetical protein PKC20_08345, partial [Burkholderiaceae bacterium]|nr:hypothetical protein [Burkholderiaceae bacterium]